MRYLIRSFDSPTPTINFQVDHTFNMFASFYTSVQSFVNALPDFRALTLSEQSSLFSRNLHGLFNFCGTFMLRDAGMFDNTRNESYLVPLYGQEIVCQAEAIARRFDLDSSLVKLIHIVFAFSTNCYIVKFDPWLEEDAFLHDSSRLLMSQNAYVEILWKYMIYRYGHEESVHRFAALIKQMLDLIVLSSDIYADNPHHQILVDDLVESAKITLVIDEEEE
jgi:hypothetical protein